jgi:predicted membrane protein
MKGVTIFENIIGILVALMILFQILPSKQTSRELNNPAYIIAFLIFLVAVFSVLNPAIGLLLLIYGYQVLVQGKKAFSWGQRPRPREAIIFKWHALAVRTRSLLRNLATLARSLLVVVIAAGARSSPMLQPLAMLETGTRSVDTIPG